MSQNKKNSSKIIALCSGGLDSTTMLYKLKAEGYYIEVLSFNYGQRHIKELKAVELTCNRLQLKQNVMELPKWHTTSSLSSSDAIMPEGHYQAENMKQTVIASRNLIFLAIASGVAVDKGFDTVAYACHSGDHFIYFDCRPLFVEKTRAVLKVANDKPVKLLTPYLYMNKDLILREGIKLSVDYSLTWSCYKGEEKPCGTCGACNERKQAFDYNNIKDPLL